MLSSVNYLKMLLTITSTSSPATDLGYLLFKNPARVHGFELSFGKATVFYPEATAERCTVCLLLEVDPIGMVRRKPGLPVTGESSANTLTTAPMSPRHFCRSPFRRYLALQ